MKAGSRPHGVVALALPGVVAADLSTAAQVFGFRDEAKPYSFTVAAESPGAVPTSTQFALEAGAGLAALETADTLIVPGYFPTTEPSSVVLRAVRAAYERGARVASVCTGAFVLAFAGLPDGRRATTHWREADAFSKRFPAVRLDANVLFVDGGRILTGAGQSASVDFYLHMVRQDFGAEVADAIGRLMVVASYRAGDHVQDIHRAGRERANAADPMAAALEWAIRELHRPLTGPQLAARAGLPERTFTRRFRARTGLAPMRWLAAQRTLEAQRLLESTDLPVDEVASLSGLGSAASLRLHFARELGSTPTDYRRTHRRPA